MQEKYDAIIVGAGIAGMMSARTMLVAKATTGEKILVIEALDRLGGRLLKLTPDVDRTPNNPVDVGACWICPEQPEVWKLAEEFGLTIVKQEERGPLRVHLSSQGGITGWIRRLIGQLEEDEEETHSGLMKLPPADILAYLNLGKKFEKMANELIQDSDKPWEAPDAEKWDTMTCEEYLQKEVPNTAARGLMRSALLTIFCQKPTEYSMLWFLTNLSAEGSFAMFMEGAQSHRVLECNGTYPERLEVELKDAGVTFLTSTKVTDVTQKEGGCVDVITHTGKTLSAKHCIVTIPPPMMSRVKFTPELPQAAYQNKMHMGKCIKTVLAYKERWWQNTFAIADPNLVEDTAPITFVADVSNDDGNEPMLATFYYGSNADRYTGDAKKAERKSTSVKGAQNLLCVDPTNPEPGSSEDNVLAVVEGDWPSNENIEGGYAAVANVGAITKTKMFWSQLGQRCGNVHFAGTETASRWAGYMEGAIVTGKKAGDEVAAALALAK